MMRD
jgi:hypothetical protein